MENKTKITIFTWLYRIFSFYVPGGVALYMFLIENLINKEVGVMEKIGVGGIFALVVMGAIAIFFYGKHFKTEITKLNNQLLECVDETKKAEMLAKKRKVESRQEIFHNACFLAPFIIIWLLCTVIEKGIVSVRGTMLVIVLSMASGFGFNGVVQHFKNKK